MPHLSPMNWLIVPMMMVFMLISLMIIMWWHPHPQFIIQKPTPSSAHNKFWKWW